MKCIYKCRYSHKYFISFDKNSKYEWNEVLTSNILKATIYDLDENMFDGIDTPPIANDNKKWEIIQFNQEIKNIRKLKLNKIYENNLH